jgi:hypothetical protein
MCSTRTTSKTFVFRNTFVAPITGIELPAGDYAVKVDEVEIFDRGVWTWVPTVYWLRIPPDCVPQTAGAATERVGQQEFNTLLENDRKLGAAKLHETGPLR